MPGVPGRPQGAHVRPRPAPQCQQAQAPSAVRDPAGVRPPWRAHEARAVQQVRGQGQGDRALEEGARWRARGRGPVPALVVRARRAASTGEASVCVLFVACPLSPLLCCVLLLTVLAGGVLLGVIRSRSCLPRRGRCGGAARAPWRYMRGVSRHHRLPLADVLPSKLTVLRGCVQVQVEAGGNWKDDGDDGALAFLPLSPPPR
jgi:hypothetical protein